MESFGIFSGFDRTLQKLIGRIELAFAVTDPLLLNNPNASLRQKEKTIFCCSLQIEKFSELFS